MVGIEIDRDDALRSGREVVQDIAPARGDGDQPVLRPKPQGFDVDGRIFPNLVVDKPLEHQGEESLEGTPFGGGGPLMCGAVKKRVSHSVVFSGARGARQGKSSRAGDTMKRFGATGKSRSALPAKLARLWRGL